MLETNLQALGVALLAFSGVLLIMLLIRTPLRRAFGPHVVYTLWIAPAVVGVGSILGAFAPARTISPPPEPTHALMQADFIAAPVMTAETARASPVLELTASPSPAWWETLDILALVLSVWAAGAIAAIMIMCIRQSRFERALLPLAVRTDWGERVYCSASSKTGPALVGIWKPRIVAPADFESRFNAEQRRAIIAHECAHLRRNDHWANAAIASVQALFWFNPLVHLAARAMRIDQELACDADSIGSIASARRVYAEAMLKSHACAAPAPLVCAWPALNVDTLKERIAMLKKPPVTVAQKRLGVSVAILTALIAGGAAWAAQPARITVADPAAAPAPIADSAWGDHVREARAQILAQMEDPLYRQSRFSYNAHTREHGRQATAEDLRFTAEIARLDAEAERMDAEHERLRASMESLVEEITRSVESGGRIDEERLAELGRHAEVLSLSVLAGEDILSDQELSERQSRALHEARRALEESRSESLRALHEIEQAQDRLAQSHGVIIEPGAVENGQAGEEIARLANTIALRALSLSIDTHDRPINDAERARIEAEFEESSARLAALALAHAAFALNAVEDSVDSLPED